MNAGDTEVAVTSIAWTIITSIAESGVKIMVLTKCMTIQLMKLNSRGWGLDAGPRNVKFQCLAR